AYPRSRIPAPPQNRTTFMAFLPSLLDGRCRDWYDETPTPLSDILQLLHDFVLQIPRQNHNIVRLGLPNPVGMINRDVSARQESTLFVRAAIDRIFDQVFADSAIVQQRGAFSRRSVPGHGLAFPRGSNQEVQQRELSSSHLSGEPFITFERVES